MGKVKTFDLVHCLGCLIPSEAQTRQLECCQKAKNAQEQEEGAQDQKQALGKARRSTANLGTENCRHQ